MKKVLCVSTFVSILLSSVGCTTIHFDNGSQEDLSQIDREMKAERWHHNMVAGLVEVSNPITLNEECEDKNWTSVKTETTALNSLAGSIIGEGTLWTPKTVTVECEK